MKKNNIKSHKKPCIHKLNIPQNAKGYSVKGAVDKLHATNLSLIMV